MKVLLCFHSFSGSHEGLLILQTCEAPTTNEQDLVVSGVQVLPGCH